MLSVKRKMPAKARGAGECGKGKEGNQFQNDLTLEDKASEGICTKELDNTKQGSQNVLRVVLLDIGL